VLMGVLLLVIRAVRPGFTAPLDEPVAAPVAGPVAGVLPAG
jgi:hypothetical protein